ncbi:DUF3298 domain-containing protein [Candidatus Latescibacterota bacterium]
MKSLFRDIFHDDNYRRFFVIATLLVLLVSCAKKEPHDNNTTPGGNPGKPTALSAGLRFEPLIIRKEYGSSERESGHYALVDITYPVASGGVSTVSDSLNTFIRDFVAVDLAGCIRKASANISIERLANMFIDSYTDFVTRFPTSVQRWTYSINCDVIYHSDTVITLKFRTDVYTGGAHPNSEVAYAVFSADTGDRITLADIITDETKLLGIAEDRFRHSKDLGHDDDLEQAGYWFTEGKFELTENWGITADGLVFFYNNYEIAAYAMGPTELKITNFDIKDIIKLKVQE